ncbi:hypothetical protein OIV83_005764 [Microbotryomycetes sp. JL201]|nr:hypothetical protein OIV83_005764 [Microbotryomycetes sp. JL201]
MSERDSSHSLLRGRHADALAPAPLDPSDAAEGSFSARRSPQASSHGHGPKDVLQKILLAGVSNQQLESSAMRAEAAAATATANASALPNLATATATSSRSAAPTLATPTMTTTAANATGLARGMTTPWYKVMARMIKQEGPTAVYKGLSASLVREATYRHVNGLIIIRPTLDILTRALGIRMGAYDGCKALVTLTFGTTSSPESFGTKLFAGMLSGMLGSAVANPADLLKVRMQAFGAQGRLRDHARDIVNERGFKGLYRAIGPTMVRAGILTSSQLGVYDHAKHTLMDDFPNVFREGFATHFAASGVAGFVCSATSSPVDVVKVRMMSSEGANYRNALHCTAVILKNEGE